ncbi:MAG: 2-oxoacid:acceptor oxidoreductase family protein [Verrucomicrobiae bacterium]|nr:2-oxoacid:acceptor oxidoreductase family protein [Verrucomicrobiae bacterium]
MAKNVSGKVDPRFLKEEGFEVYTGCELLLKGLLEVEGGTHLWTGYPGSPIAGFFDAIEAARELPLAHGIHATLANNEALSVAMVNGSQMLGLRAATAMKSVGFHVASDALALGNLAGAHREGGATVIVGDDPWSDSTQVPADSRFLARHLFMPVLEPSDPQELKDGVDVAFKLSRASGFYVTYLVTTYQADGGGSVRVRRNQWPETNALSPSEIRTAAIPVEQTVLLPPRTGRKEEELEARRRLLWQEAARLGVDRVLNPRPGAPLGFIASGLAYSYLQHAFAEMGLEGRFPILKLGLTYPVDPHVVESFAAHVRQIVVVEERRAFIEEQVVVILNDAQARDASRGMRVSDLPPVWGKRLPDGGEIPATLGLHPSMLIEKLAPVFVRYGEVETTARIERETALLSSLRGFEVDLVARTPTFCPGCPHRDSSSVLLEIKKDFRDAGYMRRRHRREPVDLLFHGDTGCYTMLMFEPNKELMHNYSGMGLGGATGAGIDPFIMNKQVVFMGDSTFFHSGQVAISNSIKEGQDITYVVLDNSTTAMTGHQPTPGLTVDLLGELQRKQSMDRIVEAMMGLGHVEVTRINPEQRDSYRTTLETTILRDGVKVIIADKECGITYHRRESQRERKEIRELGYLREKVHVNVTPEACEFCLECTRLTGCPGLTFMDTPQGTKVQTDLSWCVADTACTKTRACPAFEMVVVRRSAPPPSPLEGLDLENLPEPVSRPSVSDAWHVYLAGVGGMGIGVATATLVRAGFREGYRVLFCDKKGLAIRNGGVYSQISFRCNDVPVSNIIPFGKADLILGVDLLEAARGMDPRGNQRVASPERTAAVVNTGKTPTIMTLLGREDFDPAEIEETIRSYTRQGDCFGLNLSLLSEKYFGSKLFTNVILLGVACQKGFLPVSSANLIWAIGQTMGGAARANVQAFQLGRRIALEPARFREDGLPPRYRDTLEHKAELLARHHPARGRAAATYRRLMNLAERALRLREQDPRLREDDLRHLAIRVADLFWYQDAPYAQRYLDLLARVFGRDTAARDFAATRAVLHNLAKVMLIKDEVWVAHLLTSPEKLERDRERYGVDPAQGDLIAYRHINRPRFTLGRFNFEFDIRTRNWQLRLMKRMKFLRRLLPHWHRAEREFRDWYAGRVAAFDPRDAAEYEAWLSVLRCPEPVNGYRHIRHPKQEAARRAAEAILARLGAARPSRGDAASVRYAIAEA